MSTSDNAPDSADGEPIAARMASSAEGMMEQSDNRKTDAICDMFGPAQLNATTVSLCSGHTSGPRSRPGEAVRLVRQAAGQPERGRYDHGKEGGANARWRRAGSVPKQPASVASQVYWATMTRRLLSVRAREYMS